MQSKFFNPRPSTATDFIKINGFSSLKLIVIHNIKLSWCGGRHLHNLNFVLWPDFFMTRFYDQIFLEFLIKYFLFSIYGSWTLRAALLTSGRCATGISYYILLLINDKRILISVFLAGPALNCSRVNFAHRSPDRTCTLQPAAGAHTLLFSPAACLLCN